MTVPQSLQSRKLWAFIVMALIVILNDIFKLGLPQADVLYLISLTSAYIVSQGYVDAQGKPVTQFPVEDFTTSVTNIIQAEIAKTGFGKNLPLESIIDIVKTIMKQELSTLSVSITPIATSAPASAPTQTVSASAPDASATTPVAPQ